MKQGMKGAEHEHAYGFSMVELVVTVLIIGIIAVIAIPFFFNSQDSARQAAVEAAARDGQVMARANILEGDPTGGDLTVLETDDVVLDFANTFVRGDESTVCVRADWIGQTGNYAISGPCDEGDTTVPIFDRDPDDPMYTRFTYQCPTTKSGYLGVVNVGEGTRAQIWEEGNREDTIREVFYDEPEEDFELRYESRQEIMRTHIAEETGSIEVANQAFDQALEEADEADLDHADIEVYSQERTVRNASELVEMEGGVTYTVRFDGEIETFTAPGHQSHGNDHESLADCLVSIDHFGDDINLKNIIYLGGDNLTSVPESIPESVRALRAAFENASHFNDRNVSNWNMSNVHTTRSMFYRATSFNRPLNDWDTSSLIYAEMMFNGASEFNQDLDKWDMSNVLTTDRMFRYATDFNGDVTTWVTTNVVDMARMFQEAENFNHDISHWNVDNVTEYGLFYRDSGLEEDHRPTFLEQTE